MLCHFSRAQESVSCSGTDNKKAKKLLDEAKSSYKSGKQFREIRETIIKSTQQDNGYADAWFFLAETARIAGDTKVSRDSYKKLISLCPDLYPDAYYHLGTYYSSIKNYHEATRYFGDFINYENTNPKYYDHASLMLDESTFFRDIMAKPVPFDPHSLKGVSTPADEYLPIISPDNELIFYTHRYNKQSRNELTPRMVEEFTFAKGRNNVFGEGEKMPWPFNQSYNEGGATISADNRHLFFTVCKPEKNTINCDIYYAEGRNGSWNDIVRLGPEINSPDDWDSQPTVSADGKTMIFASSRTGGLGGVDLYISYKGADGKWSKAVNMGAPVNSAGNEKSPFLHPDGRTLYFSSDGHMGLGGFDIFISRKNEKNSWSKARNIGFPINSESDDIGFFVSTEGATGYFASNKLEGSGGWDIYSFDLYPGARPEKVLFVKGEVVDEKSKVPMAARIELKNVTTREVFHVEVDSLTGKYASVVLFDNDYIMTVKKEGYAYTSTYLAKSDSILSKPASIDMPVREIEEGSAYKLNNILFETNSFELNETTMMVLIEFAEFLIDKPTLKVAIHGHTDNIGSDGDNLILSQNRAKSVKDFLVSKGVLPLRLSHAGFGASLPVASNLDEEGRALNRRTEFVIIKK